ncbi:hypothetical protein BDZ91DRAFT_179269 [Kalaharituber pfeilii]|nr:hypothetical protein BDZ91DRAFT_179269 [Kalaharituber pfeilii]
MDIPLVPPKQLLALIEGHQNGLFLEYLVHVKPLKLCRGVGEWKSPDSAGEGEAIAGGDNNGDAEAMFPGFCWPSMDGEKLEVDKAVVGWLGSMVRRQLDTAFDVSEDSNSDGARRRKTVKESITPPLLRARSDIRLDLKDLEMRFASSGNVKVAVVPILGTLKTRFKRTKEEKEATDGDGGLHYSKRVQKEIGEWVVKEVERERLVVEEGVVGWLKEAVAGGRKVPAIEDGSKRPIHKSWDIPSPELVPVLCTGKDGVRDGRGIEEVQVAIDLPPSATELAVMKKLAEAVKDKDDDEEFLGIYQGGWVKETLDNAELSSPLPFQGKRKQRHQDAINERPVTSAGALSLPSSPPVHHLKTLRSDRSHTIFEMPSSPGSIVNTSHKRPRLDDLLIEGPLTPSPSSPFLDHDRDLKSKRPHPHPSTPEGRPRFTISLPAALPPSNFSSPPENLLTASSLAREGKAFILALTQENLSSSATIDRETPPILSPLYLQGALWFSQLRGTVSMSCILKTAHCRWRTVIEEDGWVWQEKSGEGWMWLV